MTDLPSSHTQGDRVFDARCGGEAEGSGFLRAAHERGASGLAFSSVYNRVNGLTADDVGALRPLFAQIPHVMLGLVTFGPVAPGLASGEKQ